MDITFFYNIFRFSYFIIFTGLHAILMFGIFLEWLREKKALKNEDGELPCSGEHKDLYFPQALFLSLMFI
jgi:hypothetical protein